MQLLVAHTERWEQLFPQAFATRDRSLGDIRIKGGRLGDVPRGAVCKQGGVPLHAARDGVRVKLGRPRQVSYDVSHRPALAGAGPGPGVRR